MNVAAILLGLAAAVLFAVGSAVEQTTTKQEKTTRTLDPRLFLRLLRRPRWLFGWLPDLGGTVLQALALRIGALALVEPLMLAGVFLAIPLSAALARRRPYARDLLAVVLGAVGLTAFLVAAAPRAGRDTAPTGPGCRWSPASPRSSRSAWSWPGASVAPPGASCSASAPACSTASPRPC
jgi:hypothetical protein